MWSVEMYKSLRLTTQAQKISNPFTRSLRVVHGVLPQALPFPAWGLDPGVNFGLTVIEGEKVFVFHGSLVQENKPGCYGLVAYRFLENVISRAVDGLRDARLVIEGAAYGAPFRQVELSEIRAGFFLAASLSSHFSGVQISPPATIRKEVFGNGKTQAGDEWPTLNHNAADSLAMALYAAQTKGV
jgi:hypothetical protein